MAGVSTVAVPKRSYSRASLPRRSATARATERASPSTAMSMSSGTAPAQQVTYRSAHQVGRLQPLERGQQALRSRHAPDALAQVARNRAHQSLTGMPASRIRSLASRTVCCP